MNKTALLRKTGALAFAGALACFISNASASPLFPGGTVFPVPGEPDLPGGALLASTGPVPFASATLAGTLTSEVWAADPSNPFGLGAYTFTYRISNTGLDAIHRMTVSDFAPFLTDVSFSIVAPPGLPPTYADRSTPDVIGFSFAGAPLGPGVILPGMTSALLIVQTSATVFTPTTANVINGSTVAVSSFAPAIVVPEPTALSMVALSGAALLLRRRRSA